VRPWPTAERRDSFTRSSVFTETQRLVSRSPRDLTFLTQCVTDVWLLFSNGRKSALQELADGREQESNVNLRQMWKRIRGSDAETILIAEPNPLLRRLERRALASKYQIVETSSAEEAVRTAARREGNVNLLLTEARLPRIDGWDLAELLRLDYPRLEVVFLTSTIDAEIRARTRRSKVVVLEKNRFRPDLLRRAVRDVLQPRRNERAELNGGRIDSFFSRFSQAWAKPRVCSTSRSHPP
jgi:CheY-like chemotaxis protein